ncbi:uncharacterized protein BN804_00366 [Firmicutes bacterium CAG:884]|nr:uncharacterized protein BN804_00366 [Firmicutes bacterium CAG:884]
MIPKKIYYCWFGRKPLPKMAQKCINSWKKYLKDYEIIEINEDNFDINKCAYTKEAYEKRKFAFVTDYVRLYVLYNNGGIYMDTDVEVIKNLDCFLSHDAFSGFENENYVPTGIMASTKNNKVIKELLEYYDDKHFVLEDGSLDLTTNTETITEYFVKKGLKMNNTKQIIDGFALYPNDYFCPVNHDDHKLNKTKNTYTIHWFSGSWMPKKDKLKIKTYQFLKRILGEKNLKKIINKVKHRGENK